MVQGAEHNSGSGAAIEIEPSDSQPAAGSKVTENEVIRPIT